MTRQEAGRKGGLSTVTRYGPTHMSRIGRAGYIGAVFSDPDFHHKGGQATATLYRHTQAGTGAVGVEAALLDGHAPKKKHRYLGGCACCGRAEQPGRFPDDGSPLDPTDFPTVENAKSHHSHKEVAYP